MVSFSTRERRQLSAAERDIVLASVLHAYRHHQCQLYAACVMPDHVHLLFEPQVKEQDKQANPVFWSLSDILQGIKSASAHKINQASGEKGMVWEKESLDRMIRGQSDLEEKFHYICRNPWDSGVVALTEDYPWLWTPDRAAEHARPRVSQSAPSPIRAEPSARAQTAAREGACAPPAQTEQQKTDVAFRVIGDHIRTLSFAIADGILPGNNDRNYVLRRILRRAVRYGRTLGLREPFFYKLVSVLAETMGQGFPELRARQDHIEEVIEREEKAFNRTLDRGIQMFNETVDKVLQPSMEALSKLGPKLPAAGADRAARRDVVSENIESVGEFLSNIQPEKLVFPAAEAFKLYDTYGFPLDLTELMARERGMTADVSGFNKLMEGQRARARAAQKKQVIELSQVETAAPTHFVGYDKLDAPARVLEVVALKDKTAVILDTSPFYAEMGGQVGDTGELEHGSQLWRIVDTQKAGDASLHVLADKDAPEAGAETRLSVDRARREAIQRHHTVTHLLHWALHEVVSRDAVQKGSYVGPEKLTFDFSSAPLTPQEVTEVERVVNERILENTSVTWTEAKYGEIKRRKDIMQFFGEKYGDVVRVVQIGGKPAALDGYSMELCGGTHTRATGEIGLFRIIGESAIAAGIRRIEAVSGLEAYKRANEELRLIRTVADRVKSPVSELEKKIESLLTQQTDLEKRLKGMQQKQAAEIARGLAAKAQTVGATPAILENLGPADGDFLQSIAEALKGQFQGVAVLGGTANNAAALVATVSPALTKKIQASKIMQAIAPIIGGKGGGRPDNARGGGKDVARLNEALAKARTLLE